MNFYFQDYDTDEETNKPAENEDGTVEEAKETDKPKSKKVDKTVWDWELMNTAKPSWTRKTSEVTDQEYREFYKAFTKDSAEPLVYTHFVAEGEVTFKSLLFVPKTAPSDIFQNYNKRQDTIKMYVRRVFISDTTDDLIPK